MLQEFKNKKPSDKKGISEEDFEKALADMLDYPGRDKELLSLEELDQLAQASMEDFEKNKLPELLKQIEEMDQEEIARRRRELEEKERGRNNWAAEMVRKEHERQRQARNQDRAEPTEIKPELMPSAERQPACTTSEAQNQNQKRNQIASKIAEETGEKPVDEAETVSVAEAASKATETIRTQPELAESVEANLQPEATEKTEKKIVTEPVEKTTAKGQTEKAEPVAKEKPTEEIANAATEESAEKKNVIPFKKKKVVNKKKILKMTGIAAAGIVVIVAVGLKTPFFSSKVVEGGYKPNVSQDTTGTGSYLDAGDAERVETKTTNAMLAEVAEKKGLPVIQLGKYEANAYYDGVDQDEDTVLSFILHVKKKVVHLQYLYLVNAVTVVTSPQMEYVEDLDVSGITASIYRLDVEDAKKQYFAYITQDAYMISIGTDMDYGEFCDFLKDLSIE